jgi:hypothetical protein
VSSGRLSDRDIIRIVSDGVDKTRWDQSVASVARIRHGETLLVEGEQ